MNVYHEPSYADIRAKLYLDLNSLRKEYGDSDELTQEMLRKDLQKRN